MNNKFQDALKKKWFKKVFWNQLQKILTSLIDNFTLLLPMVRYEFPSSFIVLSPLFLKKKKAQNDNLDGPSCEHGNSDRVGGWLFFFFFFLVGFQKKNPASPRTIPSRVNIMMCDYEPIIFQLFPENEIAFIIVFLYYTQNHDHAPFTFQF